MGSEMCIRDSIDIVYRETVGKFLSGIFLSIGYILVGLDNEKRALHDILCDTRVIYAKKIKIYPVFQKPIPPAPYYMPPTPPNNPNCDASVNNLFEKTNETKVE